MAKKIEGLRPPLDEDLVFLDEFVEELPEGQQPGINRLIELATANDIPIEILEIPRNGGRCLHFGDREWDGMTMEADGQLVLLIDLPIDFCTEYQRDHELLPCLVKSVVTKKETPERLWLPWILKEPKDADEIFPLLAARVQAERIRD